MSEKVADKSQKTPTSGAESPTTARELDFDDDVPETPIASIAPVATSVQETAPVPPAKDEPAPAKPPRPMSPQAQAEATLIEAFPSIDSKVVKAVLAASGGQLEPAFNALLGMTDPNYKEEQPPPQPPRKTQAQRQMDEDERLARQLAEQYQRAAHQEGYGNRGREGPTPGQRQQPGPRPNEISDGRERSFFDDDLPEIQENIRKGFQETQKTFNSWLTGIKKKIDGEDDDDLYGQPGASQGRQGFAQSDQMHGTRNMSERSRQSGDRDRYDADPEIIDFTRLQMQDNEAAPPKPPRPTANRPLANPKLFEPNSAVPPQSGPVDEVEATLRQPSPGNGKTKKWQPLTSVAPNPEADEHDPFSLGDSDDEDVKSKDLKPDDTERLKKAAADSPVSPIDDSKPIEAAERSGSTGTRNKEAEELLTKDTKT